MRSYTRLSVQEREELSLGLLAGLSLRAMASVMGRAGSTLSREVARNSKLGVYRAVRAQRYARCRRACCGRPRLDHHHRLRSWIFARLRWRWSPQQIARELKRCFAYDRTMRLSHEALYTYLYVLPRGGLRAELLSCLRQPRKRREDHQAADQKGSASDEWTSSSCIGLA